MKSLLTSLFALLVLFSCNTTSQQANNENAENTEAEVAEVEKATFPEDSVSEDGLMSFHGYRIDETNAVSVANVQEVIGESDKVENVKLEGLINAACQNKGCWMTMNLEDGKEMRVTFKDYGFFVPKDAAGKNAVVEGTLSMQTTSVDDLRHFAVDGGMSEEEAEKTITEPEVALAFEATGVIIKGETEAGEGE